MLRFSSCSVLLPRIASCYCCCAGCGTEGFPFPLFPRLPRAGFCMRREVYKKKAGLFVYIYTFPQSSMIYIHLARSYVSTAVHDVMPYHIRVLTVYNNTHPCVHVCCLYQQKSRARSTFRNINPTITIIPRCRALKKKKKSMRSRSIRIITATRHDETNPTRIYCPPQSCLPACRRTRSRSLRSSRFPPPPPLALA